MPGRDGQFDFLCEFVCPQVVDADQVPFDVRVNENRRVRCRDQIVDRVFCLDAKIASSSTRSTTSMILSVASAANINLSGFDISTCAVAVPLSMSAEEDAIAVISLFMTGTIPVQG